MRRGADGAAVARYKAYNCGRERPRTHYDNRTVAELHKADATWRAVCLERDPTPLRKKMDGADKKYTCVRCKQALPNTAFDLTWFEKNAKDWRCTKCQYDMLQPQCHKCHARPTKPLVHPEKKYLCTGCRYPKCRLCNLVDRPQNGKYRCYWSEGRLLDNRPGRTCAKCVHGCSCSACGEEKPYDEFDRAQLQVGDANTCRACTTGAKSARTDGAAQKRCKHCAQVKVAGDFSSAQIAFVWCARRGWSVSSWRVLTRPRLEPTSYNARSANATKLILATEWMPEENCAQCVHAAWIANSLRAQVANAVQRTWCGYKTKQLIRMARRRRSGTHTATYQ